MNYLSIYTNWQEGNITPQEALDQLTQALGKVQDNLEPLTQTEKTLRVYISEILEFSFQGATTKANGFELRMTSAGKNVSYSAKGLDSLVSDLLAEGETELATRISQYRQETGRSGGLRISKVKE